MVVVGFALIFLAEYASILFMRLLFCVIFLGSDLYSSFFYIRLSFVSVLFIDKRKKKRTAVFDGNKYSNIEKTGCVVL
jgi:hypothetical protein